MTQQNDIQTSGYVNFPINDKSWENTNTGKGIVVVLTVVKREESLPSSLFKESCAVHLRNTCEYIGDDRDRQSCFHFPQSYLAVVELGHVQGWTGWSEDKSSFWKCSWRDLSREGIELYEAIKMLYEGVGNIHILTFLNLSEEYKTFAPVAQ